MRGLTRPITRGLSGLGGAVTRFFTPINPLLVQYFDIPEYTFTDGSVITGKFYATESSSNALLGSTEADAAHRPYLYLSGGAIALRIPDAIGADKYIIANSPALETLKINTFSIWRSGGTVSLQFNSNTPVSLTTANGWADVFFTTIGSNNGGSFFNGYIWDVQCSTSAAPERFYALDEDLSTTSVIVDSIGGNNGTAINIAESTLFTEVADGWEGVELWNQPFLLDSGYIDNGDGTYSVNNEAAVQDIESPTAANSYPSIYRTIFEVVDISAGSFRNRVGSTNGLIRSSSGVYTENIAGVDAFPPRIRGTSGTIGTVRPITTKEFLEVAP